MDRRIPESFQVILPDEKRIILLNCGSKQLEIHDIESGSMDRLPGAVTCPGIFDLSLDGQFASYAANGNARVMNLETHKFKDYVYRNRSP